MENRTAEFLQICQSYKRKQGEIRSQKKPRNLAQENAQFTAAASDISKEIFQTSKRLQKLTQLVRQNNMFNDPTESINELAALVKKDITDINIQLDNLGEYLHSKRTSASSRQAASHSDAIVSLMKSNLMSTTRGFKDILEVRQENMKIQQNRKARYGKTSSTALGKPLAFRPPPPSAGGFGDGPPSSSSSSSNFGGNPFGSASAPGSGNGNGNGMFLPRPDGVQSEDSGSSELRPLIATYNQEQMVAEQQSYSESRAEAVAAIQSHIVDMGQMFGRLSTLIQEQGDMVQRIDDNVDDMVMNVSAGQNELLRYFTSLSNNRMLAAKVMGILFVFLVFFMFFMA